MPPMDGEELQNFRLSKLEEQLAEAMSKGQQWQLSLAAQNTALQSQVTAYQMNLSKDFQPLREAEQWHRTLVDQVRDLNERTVACRRDHEEATRLHQQSHERYTEAHTKVHDRAQDEHNTLLRLVLASAFTAIVTLMGLIVTIINRLVGDGH